MSAIIHSSVRSLAAAKDRSAQGPSLQAGDRARGGSLTFWFALLLPLFFLYGLTAHAQTAAALTSPAANSVLSSSSATFKWTAGSEVTAYKLTLGTEGSGSANLYSSGSLKTTSATVTGLPTQGVTIYVRLFSEINGAWQVEYYTLTEAGTTVPAALLSPASGSVLTGSSMTFSWSAGAGPTAYELMVGTQGTGSANLYNSGAITGTSATVTGIPTNGATVYVRLFSEIDQTFQPVYYTFTEAPALSAVSCGTASFTGSGTDACTVTLNGAAPSGGLAVSLGSSSSAVTIPASVTVAAGASSAAFSASVASVSTAQTATITSSVNGVSRTASVQLNAATPALTASSSSLTFGNVAVGSTGSQTVTFTSTGTMPVTISAASISGAGFTVSGASLPLTLNAGQSVVGTIQFAPAAAGAVTGSLSVTSNASAGSTTVVSLSGTGTAVLSSLACVTSSFTGAGTDACTVSLNTAAPTGGVSVSLASSNSSVTVPASVTVAAGATSAAFTATVASVSSSATATVTASAGGASATSSLQLNAAVPTLTVSAASVSFGSVALNSNATQTIAVNSTGTAAVTISSAAASGAGFSLVGATLPVTLTPGQTATLTLEFAPATTGNATGSLTISSNSSTGATMTVSLSGSATATPAALTSPAPGSVLPGASATFSWSAGTGVTAYQLMLGTTGAGSSDLYSSNSTTATSVSVSNLPTGGSNWGTMDAVMSCSGQTAGTAITSSVLQSCAAGSTGGFDLTSSPLTGMAVAASQGAMGAGVTVAGTSYPASTATQSLSFNHATSQQYFTFDVPGGANASVLNMNGYMTFGPAASGSTDASFDYIVAGDTNGGHAFVIQLHTGTFNGCTYCVFLETNPNWTVTNSASGIQVTPGSRYAFSVQGNENTGVASLALYNASNFRQVGSTITDVASTGGYIAHVMVGDFQSATATGTSYFEDLMLDWSGHQSFPNIPAPATIYATLSSEIGGSWQTASYTYTAASANSNQQPAQAALSAISCSSAAMTGSGSDNCTVTLNGNATGSGLTVTLASNNSAVSLPATVTVAANAGSATFTAAIAAVSTTQSATLTANAGTASQSFALQLNPVTTTTPVLSVSSSSLAFGNVQVNTSAAESVTLTSTGTASVTISSATLAGTGFTVSGASLPMTLSAGQSVSLQVVFDPTAVATDAGTLTIASNSSTGSSTTVSLSGAGVAAAYQVQLSWVAASGSDPAAGYNVYRALSGSTLYQLVNPSEIASTSFVDNTVQTGYTYDYYIESIDSNGVASAPSETIALAIP